MRLPIYIRQIKCDICGIEEYYSYATCSDGSGITDGYTLFCDTPKCRTGYVFKNEVLVYVLSKVSGRSAKYTPEEFKRLLNLKVFL
jgi:hypothetical protein